MTVGLAAFLLFSIELLAGRLVLPVFGGAAAVWTTALVLFTGLVFAGYLYAHLVATRLSPERGGVVHLAVAVVAVVATLVAPSDLATLRVPDMPAALNVLLALSLIVAAPVFLLASTTPLLSAWHAQGGRDAWYLYAVSNAASFVALFAYPLLFEPNVPLSTQRLLVTVGLVVYAGSLLVVIRGVRRQPRLETPVPSDPANRRSQPSKSSSEPPASPPSRQRQLAWLAIAFVPAALLAATTSFISTDLVAAPLVWVGPLSIYLASFVVAFSERGRRTLRYVELLVPAAATLLWLPFVLDEVLEVWLLLAIILSSYAVLSVALHGRLALDRPDERYLTRFYLIVSAGGFLATAFVALVAPLVFSTIYEYPLLIVAAIGSLGLVAGPGGTRVVWRPRSSIGQQAREAALVVAPFLIVGAVLLGIFATQDADIATLAVYVLAGAALIVVGRSPALLAGATAIAIVVFTVALAPPYLDRIRTFYGVTEVRIHDGTSFVQFSGTTIHGIQFPGPRSKEPTTYYVRSGPLGDVITDTRQRKGSFDLGVVGLGTGTIAAYAEPGDSLTFFEIDPGVIKLAQSNRFFTYLADAAVKPRIVEGDARLSLLGEPDDSFDLLVLDAFSSDAIPAHLLTREAIDLYRQKLRPGGLALFHISNRHYDLAPALETTARDIDLWAADLSYQPGPARAKELAAYPSEWVVVGTSDDIDRFIGLGWAVPQPGPLLTDDFSDVLRTLRF